jgi:5-methylcytosine-specific restriction protein A
VPTRARRRCTASGCPRWAEPEQGRCNRPEHQLPKRKPAPTPRPSPTELGYDHKWTLKSRAYRRDHPECEVTSCTKRSACTDHVDGDRSNWEDTNLQALCWPHHSAKTARHDGGFGNRRTPR